MRRKIFLILILIGLSIIGIKYLLKDENILNVKTNSLVSAVTGPYMPYSCDRIGNQTLPLSLGVRTGEFDGKQYTAQVLSSRYYTSSPSNLSVTGGCVSGLSLSDADTGNSHDKGRSSILVANVARANMGNRSDALNIFNCTSAIGGNCDVSSPSGLLMKQIGDAVFYQVFNNQTYVRPGTCTESTCTINGKTFSTTTLDLLVVGYRAFLNQNGILKTKLNLKEVSKSISADNKTITIEVSLKPEGYTMATFNDLKNITFRMNGRDISNVTTVKSDANERVYRLVANNINLYNGNLCEDLLISANITESKVSSDYNIISVTSPSQKLYQEINYALLTKRDIQNDVVLRLSKSSNGCNFPTCFSGSNSLMSQYNANTISKDLFASRCCNATDSSTNMGAIYNDVCANYVPQTACFFGPNSYYSQYNNNSISKTDFARACCTTSEAYSVLGATQFEDVCSISCFSGSNSLYARYNMGLLSNNDFASNCCSDPSARTTLGANYDNVCTPSSIGSTACFTGINSYKNQFAAGRITAGAYANACCSDPNAKSELGLLYTNYCVNSKTVCNELTSENVCRSDSSMGYIYEVGQKGITSNNFSCLTNGKDTNGNSFSEPFLADNPYCKIYCKEDVDLYFQGYGYNPRTGNTVFSGEYFTFKPYQLGVDVKNGLPTINQKRSCIYRCEVGSFTKDVYGVTTTSSGVSSIPISSSEGFYAKAEYYLERIYSLSVELSTLETTLTKTEAIDCSSGAVNDNTNYTAKKDPVKPDNKIIEKIESALAKEQYSSKLAMVSKIYDTIDANQAKNVINRYNGLVSYSYGRNATDSSSDCCCDYTEPAISGLDYELCDNFEQQYYKGSCLMGFWGLPYTRYYIRHCQSTRVVNSDSSPIGNTSQYNDWKLESSKQINMGACEVSGIIRISEYEAAYNRNSTVGAYETCVQDRYTRSCKCPNDRDPWPNYCQEEKTKNITEIKLKIDEKITEIESAKYYYLLYSNYIREAIRSYTAWRTYENKYNPQDYPVVDGFVYDEMNLGTDEEKKIVNQIKLVANPAVANNSPTKTYCYESNGNLVCDGVSPVITAIPVFSTDVKTLTSGMTINQFVQSHKTSSETITFFDIAKDEVEVELSYRLGLDLYALKPNGLAVPRTDRRFREVENNNAYNHIGYGLPIGIDTNGGKYNYSFDVTNLGKNNRLLPNFTRLNGGNKYTCNYYVSSQILCTSGDCIICNPGDDCSGSNSPTTKIIDPKLMPYIRVINTEEINPNNRLLGTNWNTPKGEAAFKKITEDGDRIYLNEPMYSFTLNSETIAEIKNLNTYTPYSDFTKYKCNSDGNNCISNFITEYATNENSKLTETREKWLIYNSTSKKFTYSNQTSKSTDTSLPKQDEIIDANLNGKIDSNDYLLINYNAREKISIPKKILFGDTTGNGVVDNQDLEVLKTYVSKGSSIQMNTPYKIAAGDLNLDGKIDNNDVAILSNKLKTEIKVPIDQTSSQNTSVDTTFKYGDLNNDKLIDSADIAKLLNIISSGKKPTSQELKAGDLNLNNKIDGADIQIETGMIILQKEIKPRKIMPGDLNFDGTLTKVDVDLLTNYLKIKNTSADIISEENVYKMAGSDVNMDAQIDIVDLALLIDKVGTTFTKYGDLDFNNIYELEDIFVLFDVIKKKIPINTNLLKAGDLNLNGKLDLNDAQIIAAMNLTGEEILPRKVIFGDINFDKRLDSTDAELLATMIVVDPNSFKDDNAIFEKSAADINLDGKVDMLDMTLLIDMINDIIIYGDIDNNKKLDNNDISLILEYINNQRTLPSDKISLVDVNLNGKIEKNDIELLKAKITNSKLNIPQKIIFGDVNEDRKINTVDINDLTNKIVGNPSSINTPLRISAADIDLSGIVEIEDLVLLVNLVNENLLKYGDYNLDGQVDIMDISSMTTVIKDNIISTYHQLVNGDMNLNGIIDQNDLQLVIHIIVSDPSLKPKKVLFGDVNEDGKIDNTDLLLLNSHIVDEVNSNINTPFKKSAADVNLDGKIDILDSVAIIDYIINPFTKYGDLNFNNIYEMRDLMILLNIVSGTTKIDSNLLKTGDLNLNGKIDLNDGQIILAMYLNEKEILPRKVNFGDINFDTKINNIDLELLTSIIAEKSNFVGSDDEVFKKSAADINLDGKVDKTDLNLLNKMLQKN